jgi:hypothetical protein
MLYPINKLYPETYSDAITVNDHNYRMKQVDLIQEQEKFEVEFKLDLELSSIDNSFIETHCISYLKLNNFKKGKYYISFK